jgi:hypothetical protein
MMIEKKTVDKQKMSLTVLLRNEFAKYSASLVKVIPEPVHYFQKRFWSFAYQNI